MQQAINKLKEIIKTPSFWLRIIPFFFLLAFLVWFSISVNSIHSQQKEDFAIRQKLIELREKDRLELDSLFRQQRQFIKDELVGIKSTIDSLSIIEDGVEKKYLSIQQKLKEFDEKIQIIPIIDFRDSSGMSTVEFLRSRLNYNPF